MTASYWDTYQQVGIKEDISDIITNISPRKTPFQDGIGSEKCWNTTVQWQEDSLRSAADNFQVEGADPTDVAVAATTMRSNYTQILWESVKVSGSADAVSTYGRAKEMAYQLAKSAAAVKRDFERHLVGVDTSATAGTSGSAGRKFASYSRLLTVANNVVYPGTGVNYDESFLLTALQNCYTNGAEPDTVMVTPTHATDTAAFAKAAGRFRTIVDQNAKASQLVNTVDLYVSPFGEVRIKINRFQKSTWTLVFDSSMWAKFILRPWTREVLAKTGDATHNMIVGEFSLKHKNFLASSLIVDNATSGF